MKKPNGLFHAFRLLSCRLKRLTILMLPDQEQLAKISMNDGDPMARKAAVKKLFDQRQLMAIAISDADPAVRNAAKAKLTDPRWIGKVTDRESDRVALSALGQGQTLPICVRYFKSLEAVLPAHVYSATAHAGSAYGFSRTLETFDSIGKYYQNTNRLSTFSFSIDHYVYEKLSSAMVQKALEGLRSGMAIAKSLFDYEAIIILEKDFEGSILILPEDVRIASYIPYFLSPKDARAGRCGWDRERYGRVDAEVRFQLWNAIHQLAQAGVFLPVDALYYHPTDKVFRVLLLSDIAIQQSPSQTAVERHMAMWGVALRLRVAHREIAVGKMITFGPYHWRVLAVQDGKAFIVSQDMIRKSKYNATDEPTSWARCTLREYLNTLFYDTFSADEKSAIEEVEVDHSYANTAPGKRTVDKVSLLSIVDVEKYSDLLYSAPNQGRPYPWWTRTLASDRRGIHIMPDGSHAYGSTLTNRYGICPAMWLNVDQYAQLEYPTHWDLSQETAVRNLGGVEEKQRNPTSGVT